MKRPAPLRRLSPPRALGGIASITIITVFARVSGGIREILIAGEFGTSAQLEAFLVAFAMVSLVVTGLGSAVPSAVVPQVHRHGRDAGEEAAALRRHVLPALAAGLACASVGAAVASAPLARIGGGGFDAETRELVRQAVVLVSPVILLAGLSSFFSALMNSMERYAHGAVAQLVNPLVTMVVILTADAPTTTTLSLAFLLGYLAEAVVAAAINARIVTAGSRYTLQKPPSVTRREFFGLLLPLSIGFIVQSSNVVVDQAVASHLPEGDVAVLAFGTRLPVFMTAVAITAVGTVVLPSYSRLFAAGHVAELRQQLRRSSALVLVVTVPVALALSIWSEPILDLVFGRGEFGPGDVAAASRVQAVAAWQLPLGLIAVLLLRMLSAGRFRRALLLVSIAAAAVNLCADVLLARWLGVTGIAWATLVLLSFLIVANGFVLRTRIQNVTTVIGVVST